MLTKRVWSAQSVLMLVGCPKETNCGNAIVEIRGGKNFCGNAIAENGRKKKIVVAEIWEGTKKKMCYFHNIFTSFFHNKSQVISYY